MPALLRKLNHKNIELYPDTIGQTIGVRRRDDSVTYVRWLGFLSCEDARALAGARPVQLVASRISNEPGLACNWIDLLPGEFVQGCLTSRGVYGVTTSHVRVLTLP